MVSTSTEVSLLAVNSACCLLVARSTYSFCTSKIKKLQERKEDPDLFGLTIGIGTTFCASILFKAKIHLILLPILDQYLEPVALTATLAQSMIVIIMSAHVLYQDLFKKSPNQTIDPIADNLQSFNQLLKNIIYPPEEGRQEETSAQIKKRLESVANMIQESHPNVAELVRAWIPVLDTNEDFEIPEMNPQLLESLTKVLQDHGGAQKYPLIHMWIKVQKTINGRIASSNATTEAIRAELEGAQANAREQQEQITCAEEELKRIKGELQEKTLQVQTIRAELEKAQTTAGKRQEQITRIKQELKRIRERCEENRTQFILARNSCRQAQQSSSINQQRLDARKQELEDMQSCLQEKEAALERLRAKIQEQNALLANAETLLSTTRFIPTMELHEKLTDAYRGIEQILQLSPEIDSAELEETLQTIIHVQNALEEGARKELNRLSLSAID